MKKTHVLIIVTCLMLCGCDKSNIQKITVTFDAGQGYFETPAMKKYYVTIAKGSLFYEATRETPLPTSLLDSYVFDAWEKDGTIISNDFVLDSDITVNAKYLYNEPITITYDLNGGKYGESSQISLRNLKGTMWSEVTKIDTNIITPPNDLMEFDAWSFSNSELESIGMEYVFDKSVTLYAHYRPIYLKLTSESNNSSVSYTSIGGIDTSGIMYSENGSNWINWSDGSLINLDSIGDSIYVKNVNNTLSGSTKEYFNFNMSGSISASGNVNSLINFAPLSPGCFCRLFENCDSLVSAPSLPSSTLAKNCYRMMFENCSSLLIAPSLSSSVVVDNSYQRMFRGCSKLEKAPVDLPATKAAFECYREMFMDCGNLEISPTIYAESTKKNSFYGMFNNCASLRYIKTYYIGDFSDYFKNWVNGVNRFGTIYYDGADKTRGGSGIPENWIVTPRRELKTFLTNCSCEPKSVDYHNGETIDLQLSPNDGYILPDEIITNAKVYVYNKEKNAFTFLGENITIYVRIDAIKV